MATIKQIKDTTDFNTTIAKGKVLIMFGTPTCGPCKRQSKILDEHISEFDNDVVIGKIDCDSLIDLASSYKVNMLPTLIIFKDGVQTKRFNMLQHIDTLVDALK